METENKLKMKICSHRNFQEFQVDELKLEDRNLANVQFERS